MIDFPNKLNSEDEMKLDCVYQLHHINSEFYYIMVVTDVHESAFEGLTLFSTDPERGTEQYSDQWRLCHDDIGDSWLGIELGNKQNFPEYFL